VAWRNSFVAHDPTFGDVDFALVDIAQQHCADCCVGRL
jgi:hypothetical protein